MIAGQSGRLGYTTPPVDLLEPINIEIREAGLHTSYAERSKMQASPAPAAQTPPHPGRLATL